MRKIPLTKGYVALVDDEDYWRVSLFKWSVQKNHSGNLYAVSSNSCITSRRSYIAMHRFILGCDQRIDHKDGDGLNNQRANLRPATNSQNLANQRKTRGSSIYKGVAWRKRAKKWRAQIKINGVTKHLGNFRDECDAAQAYNFAAEEAFGEFARLNVPIAREVLA